MQTKLQPGEKAPDFELPGVDGKPLKLSDRLARGKVTVVTFICNHCPYVHAYVERLIELQREFGAGAAGVGIVAICSNDEVTYPRDSFEHMVTAAEEWGLNFPYLRDEDQSVARAYGAEKTPEVFLLDADGVCRYEGAIDDNDKDPAGVTRRYLRDALLAVIEGREVDPKTTHAIGCTVKWKAGG